MSKKKMKAKIRKLRAQVLEARASAVAAQIAKMLIGGMTDAVISVPRKPEDGEPEIVGRLRRMAEAAAARKTEP